jgi:AAHS family 4-hydroxybenzoate transporter-like MFS transporter
MMKTVDSARHESHVRDNDAAAVEPSKVINVVELIDSHKMTFYQQTIVFLCFLVLAADGFDAGAIGYISPSLIADWHISRGALGPVMTASLLGLGLGALIAGPVGDVIGRKMVLVGSVGSFGVFSLLAAHANSVESLAVLRLLTGIGLGAAMPNALTLTSEYSPIRLRSICVCAMNAGYGTGLVIGGIVSATIIPQYGWRIILIVGGLAPMILAVGLMFLLPESLQFLAMHKKHAHRVKKVALRISSGTSFEDATFIVLTRTNGSKQRLGNLKLLFTKQHVVGTAMLWVAYFMGLLIYYLLLNWLPILMSDSGFTHTEASLMTSIFPLGGIVGTVCVGWLMDRKEGTRVIAGTFGLTAILVAVAGTLTGHHYVIALLLFVCGALLISAPTAMSALAVGYYPTQCRVTGVSWMHGIGRLGGVVGAGTGAILLSTGWNLGAIFGLLAVPAIVASGAIYIMAPEKRRRGSLRGPEQIG